jgi:ATP-dependent RNA helicase RhlE
MGAHPRIGLQVADVFKQLISGIGLHVVGIYGGVDQDKQIALLKNGADVLVATPGRMFDLASQGFLSFQNVEILIIDEADHMLELGFIHDMEQLIRRIPRTTAKRYSSQQP